jgi:hypothetical protein
VSSAAPDANLVGGGMVVRVSPAQDGLFSCFPVSVQQKRSRSSFLLWRVEKLQHHRIVGFRLLQGTKVTCAGNNDLARARNGAGELCRMVR